MPFEFGQVSEFYDPITLADPVVMVVAKAIDLGPLIGVFYQSMGAPDVPLTNTEYEIYSRSQTSRDGVIGDGAGNGWAATGTTGLKMTAAAVKGLTVGLVLQVDSEVVRVDSVDRTANTINVTARGDAASTAAAHADQVAFKVIGSANRDKDLKNIESVSETTNLWKNYTQLFLETMDWTKIAELKRKGLSEANAIALLVKEAEIRMARNLSRSSVLGRKQASIDGANRSMSAGLFPQLADNNNGKRAPFSWNVNGTFSETILRAGLKELFDSGGNPDTIWCSSTVKQYVNTFNFVNPALTVNTDATSRTAGYQIDSYNYEGKILQIKVDADIPDDKLAVVKQSSCKKGWLSGYELKIKDEPAASSLEFRKSLQGAIGYLIEDVGTDHTYFYGITGGPTERVYKTYSTGGTVNIGNTTASPVNTKEVA